MFNWLKNVIKIPTVIKEKSHCPYCNVLLEKTPSRSQKCKSCENKFVVRTDYLTKSRLCLTDEQATNYDLKRQRYYLDKGLIDGLKISVNVDEKKVDKMVLETQAAFDKKFNTTAPLGDVAWSVANKMLQEFMKKNNTQELRSIYFQMAIYLNSIGKDGNYLREIGFEIDLREYKKSEVIIGVEILATDSSCENCKALNGKIFKVDEAIKLKILPCKQCTYELKKGATVGWCRCCYAPVV